MFKFVSFKDFFLFQFALEFGVLLNVFFYSGIKWTQTLTFGVNRCNRPSVAPLRVIPRPKNIMSTTYGNVAVTYTTYNKINIINNTKSSILASLSC